MDINLLKSLLLKMEATRQEELKNTTAEVKKLTPDEICERYTYRVRVMLNLDAPDYVAAKAFREWCRSNKIDYTIKDAYLYCVLKDKFLQEYKQTLDEIKNNPDFTDEKEKIENFIKSYNYTALKDFPTVKLSNIESLKQQILQQM